MEESTGKAWYLNINIIIFVLATISLFLFARVAEEHFDAVVSEEGRNRSIMTGDLGDTTDRHGNTTGAQNIYMGGTSGYKEAAAGTYATAAAVFTEILNLPPSITNVYIDGTWLINDMEAYEDKKDEPYDRSPWRVSTPEGDQVTNIAWFVQKGEEKMLWDTLGLDSDPHNGIYKRTCEYDSEGNLILISYSRPIGAPRIDG